MCSTPRIKTIFDFNFHDQFFETIKKYDILSECFSEVLSEKIDNLIKKLPYQINTRLTPEECIVISVQHPTSIFSNFSNINENNVIGKTKFITETRDSSLYAVFHFYSMILGMLFKLNKKIKYEYYFKKSILPLETIKNYKENSVFIFPAEKIVSVPQILPFSKPQINLIFNKENDFNHIFQGELFNEIQFIKISNKNNELYIFAPQFSKIKSNIENTLLSNEFKKSNFDNFLIELSYYSQSDEIALGYQNDNTEKDFICE